MYHQRQPRSQSTPHQIIMDKMRDLEESFTFDDGVMHGHEEENPNKSYHCRKDHIREDEDKFAVQSISPTSCCDMEQWLLSVEAGNGEWVDLSNLVHEHERTGEPLQRRLDELQANLKSLLASRSSGLSTVLESPRSLESMEGSDDFYMNEEDYRDITLKDQDDEACDESHSSVFYPVEDALNIPELCTSISIPKITRPDTTNYGASEKRRLSSSIQKVPSNKAVDRNAEFFSIEQISDSQRTSKPGTQSVRPNREQPSREELKLRQMEAFRGTSSSVSLSKTLFTKNPGKPGAQLVGPNSLPSREELKIRQMDAFRQQQQQHVRSSNNGNHHETKSYEGDDRQQYATSRPGAQSIMGRPTREDLKQREMEAFRSNHPKGQPNDQTNEAEPNSRDTTSKPGTQTIMGRSIREDLKQREMETFRSNHPKCRPDGLTRECRPNSSNNTNKPSVQSMIGCLTSEDLKQHEMETCRTRKPIRNTQDQAKEVGSNSREHLKQLSQSFLTEEHYPNGLARQPSWEERPAQMQQRNSFLSRRRSFEEMEPPPRNFQYHDCPQPIHESDSSQILQRENSWNSNSGRRQNSVSSGVTFRSRDSSLRSFTESSFRSVGTEDFSNIDYQNFSLLPPLPTNSNHSTSNLYPLSCGDVGSHHNNRYFSSDPLQGPTSMTVHRSTSYSDHTFTNNNNGNTNRDSHLSYQPNLVNGRNSNNDRNVMPPPSRNNEVFQIEIEPGCFAHLRGAEETWAAARVGRLRDGECFACSLSLQCIIDAEYLLCPDCKVVSPLFGDATTRGGGVGLGLKANPSVSSTAALADYHRHQQNSHCNNNNHYDYNQNQPPAYRDNYGSGRYI